MALYQQIFFTTLAVSFGILHLILFVYNNQFKSNLFFSIFLFLYALNIFFDYQASLTTTREIGFIFLRLHRGVMPYNSVFALLFLYYAFDLKIPKHFWIIFASLAITGFFAVLEPIRNFDYVQFAQIVVILEAVRIFAAAFKKKKNDAWIITTGFILLFFFSAYDLLLDLRLMQPISNITNAYPFGFVCLILSSSTYLARQFAKANRRILNQERQNKEMEISKRLLEAEDKRKARELGEAREIQMSLLPNCITNISNYEFCFDMRTASEVGGDYYDYSINDSGEITLVVGDATDHGMKAGMMVSIIKGLFLTNANHTNIKDFLNSCSRTIKKMKLKNLYMALMVIRINGRHLSASSAGIPPIFIYRKKDNTIEEFKIKGMPLGAFDYFPYETIKTELEIGDTVLLMTDGLPDLFNKDNESFGNERIKEVFLQNASLPANNIIKELFSAGERWRGDHKQNDDITLIAFRPKEGKI